MHTNESYIQRLAGMSARGVRFTTESNVPPPNSDLGTMDEVGPHILTPKGAPSCGSLVAQPRGRQLCSHGATQGLKPLGEKNIRLGVLCSYSLSSVSNAFCLICFPHHILGVSE